MSQQSMAEVKPEVTPAKLKPGEAVGRAMRTFYEVREQEQLVQRDPSVHTFPLSLDGFPGFGGISGITHDEKSGLIYAVSDDTRTKNNPGARVYVMGQNPLTKELTVEKELLLKDEKGTLLGPLDMEEITFMPNGKLYISTESYGNKPGQLLTVDPASGVVLKKTDLDVRGMRENSGNEALTLIPNGDNEPTVVTISEQPLTSDTSDENNSNIAGRPLRLKVGDNEYLYAPDPVMIFTNKFSPDPKVHQKQKGSNGVVSACYDKETETLYIMERAFVPGAVPEPGSNEPNISNRVAIYSVKYDEADKLNGLSLQDLIARKTPIQSVQKTLVWEFKGAGNLEGFTLVKDKDGRAEFLVTEDNNFNNKQGGTEIYRVPLNPTR